MKYLSIVLSFCFLWSSVAHTSLLEGIGQKTEEKHTLNVDWDFPLRFRGNSLIYQYIDLVKQMDEKLQRISYFPFSERDQLIRELVTDDIRLSFISIRIADIAREYEELAMLVPEFSIRALLWREFADEARIKSIRMSVRIPMRWSMGVVNEK